MILFTCAKQMKPHSKDPFWGKVTGQAGRVQAHLLSENVAKLAFIFCTLMQHMQAKFDGLAF